MDSSTSAECRELDARFGARLQADTGSPAIERFTGPQIRKFAKTEPERYAQTTRIHLVSSFLCSVLIGRDAPIDSGDGAGMNLLNLRAMAWDPEIAAFTAPGLAQKLPTVGSGTAGGLSPYFTKYGLRAGYPSRSGRRQSRQPRGYRCVARGRGRGEPRHERHVLRRVGRVPHRSRGLRSCFRQPRRRLHEPRLFQERLSCARPRAPRGGRGMGLLRPNRLRPDAARQ
jgi:hypothetical protein